MKQYITKEQFIKLLDFLSRFGGFTDLGDEDMQDELWGYYEEEKEVLEK